MSKGSILIYHPVAVDDNMNDDFDQRDSDVDGFTDSDFEPELPPNNFDESDLPKLIGNYPINQSHIRSDSASTSTSLPSSSSAQSVRSNISGGSCNRNKYLFPDLDTVQPLRPEELRWFYREVSEKKWIPFIGYDSLRIECKYRETLHRMGTNSSPTTVDDDTERVIVRGGIYEVDVIKRKCHPIYWTQKGEATSIMRGTWFLHGSWQPIEEHYANQIETEHLLKFENQKCADEVLEQAKGPPPVIHNIRFTEFHIDWNSVTKVYLHYETASSKFYRAVGTKLGLNKSGTRIHRGYSQEATMDDKPPDITHLMFVIHGIGQKMETGSIIKSCKDLRITCKKLKHKYFPGLDEANKRVEFLPVEWRSLLKLDGDTVESITPNKLKGLRTMLNSSAMDILYYTSPLYRSEITQGLQTELNKLYDMFCSRHPYFEAGGGKVSIVSHSLGCVITYDIITGWNPIQLYDQYVSSFIDEKCQQVNDCSDLISELEHTRKRVSEIEKEILNQAEKQHLKTPSLKFKLENFFCLGSPLAVFLALRGIRPQAVATPGVTTQDHILPTSLCQRLYNIYHPSDPVAYRLEPLILKHYVDIKPLRVHRADASKKEPYENLPEIPLHTDQPLKAKAEISEEGDDKIQTVAMEAVVPEDEEEEVTEVNPEQKEEKEPAEEEKPVTKKGGGWGFVFRRNKKNKELSRENTPTNSPKLRRASSTAESEATDQKSDAKSEEDASEKKDPEQPTTQEPEMEHRLDFQLREGKMEHAYLAALTSHTSYWLNQDVAMFIMTQIFADYGPR